MRRMDNWVFLALLALVTISEVHCNCIDREQHNSHCSYSDDHDWRHSDHDAIFPGAKIVTYGDPCCCRDSIPYSVQVPKPSTSQIQESLKSYGYSVEVPPQPSPSAHHSFPVKIQTPVTSSSTSTPSLLPSLPYSIERVKMSTGPSRIPPMSAAIQTPVTPAETTPSKFVGLSTKVDRVLVPACPIEGCPLCEDVKARGWC